ncbi:hypothetical protein BMF94_4170 [Rhodotorula taiwanensis]|uniref:Amino acid transporter transmembrane domain-containing protein n=1 Tax=Rhodotorula taiwanensis TaxID=741276 RepID=A0A2S5B7K8_9BASI|nr:hypothetical protein BMF94_4170 [Rhodotorula taiwanensis]
MQAPAWSGVADPQMEGNMNSKEMETWQQPQHSVLSDKISLAEYCEHLPRPPLVFWAQRQRAREKNDTIATSAPLAQLGRTMMGKMTKSEKSSDDDSGREVKASVTESGEIVDEPSGDLVGLSPYETELCNARRALRVAGWSTIFYLITTDILGPFNEPWTDSMHLITAPYAIASMGMGPGVALYIIFGIIAFITGCMLNYQFLHLDSIRFPVRTFGDLGGRLMGTWMRHLCSFLQAVQLILNVGLIQLSNGQGVAQIAAGHGSICFSIAVAIWCWLGIVIGQIRTLRGLGFFANAAVWINFLSMGFIAHSMHHVLKVATSLTHLSHSPPNYAAAKAAYGIDAGPVQVVAVVNQPVFAQVNGYETLSSLLLLFPELMTEMRRPHDFIRGMALAQALIIVCYLMYGIYVYAMQGQFTLALAYQGVSKYAWQTVGNVLALITGAIAAALYGNIGLKVLYINIVEGIFKGPPLMSKKGRLVWGVSVIFFWGAAFAIGSGIPSVGTLSGLVAAICIFQFTYTFPPLFMLALEMHKDAMKADEPFETAGVAPRQADTWRQASRWRRGIFGGTMKSTILKFVYFVFFLASLATAGLGMWASGTDLREALAAGAASSFGCASPV